jgi:plastocyanin
VKLLRATVVSLTLLLGIYAIGCGGNDKNPVSPGGGGADVTINIVANNAANSYSPSPDTMLVGQTVAWHNSDSTPHTATSDVGSAIGTGSIAAGATSAKIAMNTQGSFPYHCSIHPSMTGILVVK